MCNLTEDLEVLFLIFRAVPSQIDYCRRIFQSLITYSVQELCEIANSQIAPVQLGVARPTASFPLVPSSTDVATVMSL